jgi:hypothetical protein
MLVSDALRKIKRQFGDEYNVVIIDQDIFDWIHEAELDIIRSVSDNDLTLSVPSSTFPLSIPEKVTIKRVSINHKTLMYITLPQLDMMRLNELEQGETQYWYFQGAKVYLYPVPTVGTTTISVTYVKAPDEIISSAGSFTVPEVYHEDVVRFCLSRAHNKNQNFRAAEAEMEAYDRRVSNRRNEAQSPDTILYKAPDPFDYDEYVVD